MLRNNGTMARVPDVDAGVYGSETKIETYTLIIIDIWPRPITVAAFDVV